jgi:hypothetical protein
LIIIVAVPGEVTSLLHIIIYAHFLIHAATRPAESAGINISEVLAAPVDLL